MKVNRLKTVYFLNVILLVLVSNLVISFAQIRESEKPAIKTNSESSANNSPKKDLAGKTASPILDKSIVIAPQSDHAAKIEAKYGLIGLKTDTIRIQNEKSFFDALNLDTPGMENVKMAVSAGDWSAAKKALLEYMRARKKPVFPMDRGRKKEIVDFAKEEFPQTTSKVISSADNVCRHEFNRWGDPHVFDGPIIWDRTKNNATVCFSQMLNRMGYLKELGTAWWLTDNQKYSQCAVEIVDSFIKSSPMPTVARRSWMAHKIPDGMNSVSSTGSSWGTMLEIAERMGNWLVFNECFIDSPEVSPEFYYRFLSSLLEQARYTYLIELYGGYQAGNWHLIENSNFARVAIMFPEFKESDNWWKTAIERMTKKAETEVFPDGGYIERCISYHNWCLQKFLEVSSLANANGVKLPESFSVAVAKMQRYVQALSYPDNTRTPAFGDASYVLWWADKKTVPQKTKNILELWDVGFDSYKKNMKDMTATPDYTSTELPYTGFYIMRTGWKPQDKYLFFDCVPSGDFWSHWHNSAFNVDIYAYGRPLIVDSGMQTYDDTSYEDYCHRSIAHNIIEIANVEVLPVPELKYWLRSPEFCVVDAQANITIHYGHRILITRRVIFVTNDYWIMNDIVAEQGLAQRSNIPVRTYWHLNSRSIVADSKQIALAVTDKDDGYGRYYINSGKDKNLSFYTNDKNIGNLLFIPDKPENYKSLAIMSDTPCGGYVACYKQDMIPSKNPTRYFTSLLYPFEGDKRPDVSFKDGVVKIGNDRVDNYFRKGEQTDGDCALVSRQKEKLKHVLLVRGSFIKDVIHSDGSVQFLIINRTDDATLDIKVIGGDKATRLNLTGFDGIKQATVNGQAANLAYDKNMLIINGPFMKVTPDPNNTKLFWIVK